MCHFKTVFGARATGKSTLLKGFFSPKEAYWIDLLNPDLEDELIKNPQNLINILDPLRDQTDVKWIVINEIQNRNKKRQPKIDCL